MLNASPIKTAGLEKHVSRGFVSRLMNVGLIPIALTVKRVLMVCVLKDQSAEKVGSARQGSFATLATVFGDNVSTIGIAHWVSHVMRRFVSRLLAPMIEIVLFQRVVKIRFVSPLNAELDSHVRRDLFVEIMYAMKPTNAKRLETVVRVKSVKMGSALLTRPAELTVIVMVANSVSMDSASIRLAAFQIEIALTTRNVLRVVVRKR